MVRKRRAAAVTKEDLVEVIQGLETRLDAKFDAKLDSKIGGLRTELMGELGSLKTRFGGMELNIRRLMAESVDTNGRMRAMEDRLITRMDAGRAEDASLREAFLSRMETLWQRTVTFPKILDEHGAALTGHDQRLKALEARQSP